MTLVELCYGLSKRLPKDEMFGLISQIRRAAVSIPANISEGYGRDQTGNFIYFLRISLGSSRELDTHLQLVVRLGMVEAVHTAPCRELNVRVSKMLRSLIRSLEAKQKS